jgi:Holliday junction resolvase RusA-like endonuclease
MDGPVAVDIAVTVAKPKSAPKTRRTWPATRSSGDADKHARNVLDALVDAAVIGDDSQVVELAVRKVFPGEAPDALASAGAVIVVRPIVDVLDPAVSA